MRTNVLQEQEIGLRKKSKTVQSATDMFWEKWLKKIIPTNIDWKKEVAGGKQKFKVGDLILISDYMSSVSGSVPTTAEYN